MRKKGHKVFLLLLFTLLLICMFTTTVFAAGKNLFEVADDIIRDVYTHIVGISTVLGLPDDGLRRHQRQGIQQSAQIRSGVGLAQTVWLSWRF